MDSSNFKINFLYKGVHMDFNEVLRITGILSIFFALVVTVLELKKQK